MSNLVPGLIGLDKGLNLQTAKIVAPAGSILDCINYEQVDFQGQKRIDGFTRYDGGLLSALDDYYKITLTSSFAGAATDLVATSDGLLGVVAEVSTNIVYVAIINDNLIPAVGDELFRIVNGASVSGNVITAVVAGVDSGITADQHYTNLLSFTSVLRNRVEALPGGIIGLHWFRDRLYAVGDVVAVSLLNTSPVIYPNDTLVRGSETVKVLDSFVLDNTRIVYIDSMTPDPWAVEGTEVYRNASLVGVVADGFEDMVDIASFFESRSEQQVLTEDGPSGPYNFGWRFVDHGWKVLFENGQSLYGSLPSLNQNISGLGVQGPTSITGNNGKALLLSQKVSISDKPTQVNGWKSSQTPTTFELETENLTSVDSTYIYADAYITWNGTTGEVVGSTDTLTEYPATNTVEIEL